MKKLLLMDNRYTADSSDMWRTAIRRGWQTQRTNMFQVEEHCKGYDLVRYYGNTLHAAQIKDKLPFKFDVVPAFLDIQALLPYTKRKILSTYFGALKQPIEEDCFIKPVWEKWFEARVYRKGESIIDDACHASDNIYVSEIVKCVDEVRCFCLNGEILTSSYYRLNSVVWDLTNESPELLNFDDKLKDTPLAEYVRGIYKNYHWLPRGVVLDFATNEKGDWFFVEPNEAYASGLYYCNYDKCLDVIIESVSDKL